MKVARNSKVDCTGGICVGVGGHKSMYGRRDARTFSMQTRHLEEEKSLGSARSFHSVLAIHFIHLDKSVLPAGNCVCNLFLLSVTQCITEPFSGIGSCFFFVVPFALSAATPHGLHPFWLYPTLLSFMIVQSNCVGTHRLLICSRNKEKHLGTWGRAKKN